MCIGCLRGALYHVLEWRIRISGVRCLCPCTCTSKVLLPLVGTLAPGTWKFLIGQRCGYVSQCHWAMPAPLSLALFLGLLKALSPHFSHSFHPPSSNPPSPLLDLFPLLQLQERSSQCFHGLETLPSPPSSFLPSLVCLSPSFLLSCWWLVLGLSLGSQVYVHAKFTYWMCLS